MMHEVWNASVVTRVMSLNRTPELSDQNFRSFSHDDWCIRLIIGNAILRQTRETSCKQRSQCSYSCSDAANRDDGCVRRLNRVQVSCGAATRLLRHEEAASMLKEPEQIK